MEATTTSALKSSLLPFTIPIDRSGNLEDSRSTVSSINSSVMDIHSTLDGNFSITLKATSVLPTPGGITK